MVNKEEAQSDISKGVKAEVSKVEEGVNRINLKSIHIPLIPILFRI
jgi:hypothetical protein